MSLEYFRMSYGALIFEKGLLLTTIKCCLRQCDLAYSRVLHVKGVDVLVVGAYRSVGAVSEYVQRCGPYASADVERDDLVAVVFAVYTVGDRHVHAVAVDAAVAYDGCYADEARGA